MIPTDPIPTSARCAAGRLQTTRRGLEREVRASEHGRLFEARRAAFAPHATIGEVLDALAERSPETFGARERLVRALLIEQQKERHPLWAAALTLAFLRALGRLAFQFPVVEREQLVLGAFLDAVQTLPLRGGTHVVFSLLCETRRRALRTFLADKRYGTLHIALASEPSVDAALDELVDRKARAERWASFCATARPADIAGLRHRRPAAVRRLVAHFNHAA